MICFTSSILHSGYKSIHHHKIDIRPIKTWPDGIRSTLFVKEAGWWLGIWNCRSLWKNRNRGHFRTMKWGQYLKMKGHETIIFPISVIRKTNDRSSSYLTAVRRNLTDFEQPETYNRRNVPSNDNEWLSRPTDSTCQGPLPFRTRAPGILLLSHAVGIKNKGQKEMAAAKFSSEFTQMTAKTFVFPSLF